MYIPVGMQEYMQSGSKHLSSSKRQMSSNKVRYVAVGNNGLASAQTLEGGQEEVIRHN